MTDGEAPISDRRAGYRLAQGVVRSGALLGFPPDWDSQALATLDEALALRDSTLRELRELHPGAREVPPISAQDDQVVHDAVVVWEESGEAVGRVLRIVNDHA